MPAATALPAGSLFAPSRHEQSPVVSPVMTSGAPSVASASSDGMSVVSGMTSAIPHYLASTVPPPDYVSQPSASQTATDCLRARRNSLSDQEEETPEGERVLVAENAVVLVNTFLDKILHDFLYTARSTSILALRPAVVEVLRRSLARDAICVADANLEDLLAIDSEEEEQEDQDRPTTPKESVGKWNMEFVWKRVRLRVMMRSEKSDFDVEDDERHVREQGLVSPGRRWSQTPGFVSLSVEIFLAGVLDYVADQIVIGAAHQAAARARRRSKRDKEDTYRVIIEEQDIEKGALNSPMDRLWRHWRKSLRSRGFGHARGDSSDTTGSFTTASLAAGRRGSEPFPASRSTNSSPSSETSRQAGRSSYAQHHLASDHPEQHFPEHVLASNIPLPIGPRDVDEIEVPGLAKDPDASDGSRPSTATDKDTDKRRTFDPRMLSTADRIMLADNKQPRVSISMAQTARLTRKRSSSLPSLVKPRYKTSAIQATDFVDPQNPTTDVVPIENKVLIENKDSSLASDATTTAVADKISSSSHDADTKNKTLPVRGAQIDSTDATRVDTPSASHGDGISLSNDQPVMSKSTLSGSTETSELSKADGTTGATHNRHDSTGTIIKAAAAGAGVSAIVTRHLNKGVVDDSSTTVSPMTDSDEIERQMPLSGTKIASSKPEDEPVTAISDGAQEQDQIYKAAMRPNSKTGTLGRVSQRSTPNPSPVKEESSPNKTKRNREAAVGLGLDTGISIPEGTSSVSTSSASTYNQGATTRDVPSPQTNGSHWDPDKSHFDASRPDSYASDSAESDLSKTPREFLASRKLSTTRGDNRQGVGDQVSTRIVRNDTPNTNDFGRSAKISSPGMYSASSPTIPEEPLQETRPINNTHADVLRQERTATRTLSQSPPQTNADFRSRSKSTPQRPKQERAGSYYSSGSESNERKGSVRRVGVERNGSIVSNNSFLSKSKKPLTSASITSPADFDMFVQGDETIKYTLTPDAARDSPPSSVNVRQVDPKGRASSDLVRGGHVQTADTADKKERGRSDSTISNRRSVSRPATRNKSQTRHGLIPREATVQTDSTRDFSDFIRSTGPEKEPQTLVPAIVERSRSSMHSIRSGNGRNGSIHSQHGNQESVDPNAPPMPAVPATLANKGARSNLTARPATSGGNPNGDLIDFIRNGPNIAGAQRIPESVAPWAKDNDNDDGLKSVAGLQDAGNSASTSTMGSVGPHSSNAPSTVGSRAPLLSNGSANGKQPVLPTSRSGVPSVLAGSSSTGTDGKKRYRNKDPYAIDFSDDDDDEILASLTPKLKQDEGLADFLRDNEPPTNNGPALLASSKAAAQTRATMKDRAHRQAPTLGQPNLGPEFKVATPASPSKYVPSVANSSNTNATSSSSSTTRPAQIRSQISGGVPTASTQGPQIRSTSGPKMQVRAAGSAIAPRNARMNALHDNSTGDLADFLRSSGPPPEPAASKRNVSGGSGAPAPVIGTGAAGGGGKTLKTKSSKPKFWQRRRNVDLP